MTVHSVRVALRTVIAVTNVTVYPGYVALSVKTDGWVTTVNKVCVVCIHIFGRGY